MSNIPAADLPRGTPGPFDSVVGVDEATGDARRFPVPTSGAPTAYATVADLPAGAAEGAPAYVIDDPTLANNGLWGVLGGVWVQSADRVTALEARVLLAEQTVAQTRRDFEIQGDGLYRAGVYTENFTVTPIYRGVQIALDTASGDGDFYWAIYPVGVEEPVRAEIEAGEDIDGTAAIAFGSAVVGGVDVLFDIPRVLGSDTSYEVWCFQRADSGYVSQRRGEVFTTPLIIKSGAYNGAQGDLANATGVVFAGNQADSAGGTKAVLLTDSGDAAVAQMAAKFDLTFVDGQNYIEFVVKKIGGSIAYMRLQTLSVTNLYSAHINLTTGAVSGNSWPVVPTVTDLGGGWFKVRVMGNYTGAADRTGTVQVALTNTTGTTNITRDGTNKVAIHNAFVSDE